MQIFFSGKMGVRVKKLNWLEPDMEMENSENSFGWQTEDLNTLRQVKIFLAADGKVSLLIVIHYQCWWKFAREQEIYKN